MGRRPVYIAGPYGAPTAEEIEANVQRACQLARLATAWGLAPLVPHAIGWMGCHGARDESTAGVREAAIASGAALAAAIGESGGHLWVILGRHGHRTVGVQREVRAYFSARPVAAGPGAGRVIERRWEEWCEHLADAGLEAP